MHPLKFYGMLIAVHFPKAGGVSIGMALKEAYGDGFVADYADDPAVPELPRALDPIGYFERKPVVPDNALCFFGHFHPNKYRAVTGAKRFVMLRHPIDNLLSIHWFFRSVEPGVGGSLMRYVRDHDLSIIQLAQLPLLRRLMSWTYFEGVDMATFDLIGRHERRSHSLPKLSALIDRHLDPNIIANRTPESDERRQQMESDRGLRGRLADILFYERYAFRDL